MKRSRILDDFKLLPEDRKLLQILRHIGHQISRKHELKLNLIGHRPKPSCKWIEGRCYFKEGIVTITIRNKIDGHWCSKRKETDRILGVLAHELAHLEYADHSHRFRCFERWLYADICKLVPTFFEEYIPGRLCKLYAG